MSSMFTLVEATIRQIHAAFVSGELAAEDLVYRYMARIAEYDGPRLNAILEINPDAPAIGAACDARRRAGQPMGPLHGIPILLKDNIDTGDKLHTSAGSLALADSYAPCDASLVARLRQAGAVILGKANMTEWANWMTQGMPGGFSARGGQVLNPYGSALPAGGSSTGSGVAVSANLCTVAIGTETSGSILSPAVNNMVVGIKPTVGLVSRAGVIPISHTQDTAGPIARTVEDAARVLGALVGVDPLDPITGAQVGRVPADYTATLAATDLSGVRIGVPREVYWSDLDSSEAELAERAIRVVADLGAEMVDPADIPTAAEVSGPGVLVYEFKSAINAYLNHLGPGAPVRSLREIIAFNRAHRASELRYGQKTLLRSQRRSSGTLTEPEYADALSENIRICRHEGIDATLSGNRLDALLFPGLEGSSIAARAGYPSIAVPVGLCEGGRPYGVTFCGSAFSEISLIRFAHAFERAMGPRTPPDLDS